MFFSQIHSSPGLYRHIVLFPSSFFYMKYAHNPEGYRNPNDIHDLSSRDEIEDEISLEHYREQMRFRFDLESLDADSRKLLREWEKDMATGLHEWKVTIEELTRKESRISQKMREYLEDTRMDLPTFDVYKKQEADALLRSYGFTEERVQSKNFLVVFNLPKPLSQFWWKGGIDAWGGASKDVRGMVIEWGDIYRKVIPVIWNARDNSNVPMERVNPGGVHDPRLYYYVWEMGTERTDRYDN